MKRIVCFITMAAMLVLLLGACVHIQRYPSEGIWYCEDLDIYLDLKNDKGMYMDENGAYEPLMIQTDYGTGFFIYFCESDRSEEYENCEPLQTDCRYWNDVLTLKDRDSDKVYEFIEIDGDMYPKG